MTTPRPPAGQKPDNPATPAFSGIFVPRLVLEDPRLSNTERLLFGMIDGLDTPRSGCFGSNSYLCGRLDIQPRSLQNSLKKLESFGYITRRWGRSGRQIRTASSLVLEGMQKNAGGVQKNARGGCKKMHPYIKEDRKDLNTPLPPFKGGRRRSLKKLGEEDYGRGF